MLEIREQLIEGYMLMRAFPWLGALLFFAREGEVMKRKKIFLLCGLAVICCFIGLAGCNRGRVHDMQFVAAAEPTCTEEGRKAYWFCKDCNKYFADEGGATEISPDSLAIEAAGHDISEEWSYNGEEHWHECKRCSEKFESAPHVFGETDYCTCGFEIPSTENPAYRLSEDKSYCIITGIGDAETEYLFIPREIDGKPVKEIADNAFKGNTEIKSVRISSSVVSIGDYAFAGCSNLDGITIGINVKTLGDNAFSHCKKLKEINFNAENMDDLGDIVMEYYNTAFFDAGVDEDGITVTFGDSVERIPAFLFVISKSWEGSPNIKSVKMGKNITTIGDGAFCGCSTLEKVAFSEAVTTIGLGAFAYCSGLTGELVLPDKVKTIGLQAFSETEIIGVTIPSSVNYVGRWAFSDCKKLNEVRYKGDIADWCAISFGGWGWRGVYIENLYINNELVKDLIIPEGVTDIGSYAFNGFSGLTSVTISASLTSIGSSAISQCI